MMKKKDEKHHPAQTGFTGLYGTVEVDLGSNVGIRWTEWEGERVGGILVHDKPDGHKGRCEGAFFFKDNAFHTKYPRQRSAQWTFNGDYEKPDLNPSFLCHCGFHGWVRNGRWVAA